MTEAQARAAVERVRPPLVLDPWGAQPVILEAIQTLPVRRGAWAVIVRCGPAASEERVEWVIRREGAEVTAHTNRLGPFDTMVLELRSVGWVKDHDAQEWLLRFAELAWPASSSAERMVKPAARARSLRDALGRGRRGRSG